MLSVWTCPRVITLSGLHCTYILETYRVSQRRHQIFVWRNSCSIVCSRYFIRQHSRFARLLLPVCIFDCWWLWERQLQSNRLTIREVCCSLVFVLLIVSSMDLLQSIAIRRFQNLQSLTLKMRRRECTWNSLKNKGPSFTHPVNPAALTPSKNSLNAAMWLWGKCFLLYLQFQGIAVWQGWPTCSRVQNTTICF
jgi:hypothetical protein